MKKSLIILTMLFAILSCRNTAINGKLDGMWQLMEISKIDEPSVNVKTERIYYSFQLDLMEFRKNNIQEHLGRFNHTGDSLFFYDIRNAYVNDELASLEELALYGLSNAEERFSVEKLTSSRMILRSKYSILTLRKF